MIYFTSDLHFWHKNAIIYTNRPFETVEEMNEKLKEYWNKTVHANDEVYILGDVTMVRPGRAPEIISFKDASMPSLSDTFLLKMVPPKYLLLIATVLLTRLPIVFASSEFHLSTIRS